MTQVRTERIRADDGHEFNAHLALPDSAAGPGLVVFQEIFGVNDYMKGVCGRLAALGYVALAPDLFSRIEPGIALDEFSPDGLPQAFAYMGRLDVPQAIDDGIATLQHARKLPEVAGRKAGVIGFCLGGGIAYFVAARSDPDVAVCYYGSAIPDGLGEAAAVRCPVLFHYGDADAYVPAEKRDQVRSAFEGRAGVEFHVHHGANHAFDNPVPLFHHPDAATAAWEQTTRFLRRELPV